jgi:hypothetical protein
MQPLSVYDAVDASQELVSLLMPGIVAVRRLATLKVATTSHVITYYGPKVDVATSSYSQ